MGLNKILKALANQRRMTILKLLQQERELTVGEIADNIDLSFRSTSRHLVILVHADILERRQRNLNQLYRLSDEPHPLVSLALSYY